jgi:hypothetical protein
MKCRILLPLASLLIATAAAEDKPEPPAAPAASAETEHQTDYSFAFTLKPDNAQPSKAVLFTDFTDSDIGGTVTLPGNLTGLMTIRVSLGMPKDDPRRMVVTVCDSNKPLVLDNHGVVRNHLVQTEFRYRGPGTYRIAWLADGMLTVTVKETAVK